MAIGNGEPEPVLLSKRILTLAELTIGPVRRLHITYAKTPFPNVDAGIRRRAAEKNLARRLFVALVTPLLILLAMATVLGIALAHLNKDARFADHSDGAGKIGKCSGKSSIKRLTRLSAHRQPHLRGPALRTSPAAGHAG